MSDHLDLSGWVPTTCAERERIVHGHTRGELNVFSTITDPHGTYGQPLVFTEWGISGEDRPVLRDYLPYNYDGQQGKCTHYTRIEDTSNE